MRKIISTVLAASSLMGFSAQAQDSEFPTLQELEDKANGVVERFGDWEIRCQEGTSCRMVQLAVDAEGNGIASATMQVLPEGASAKLGVVLVSPLRTLLPRGISVAVDGSVPAAYPFSWCDPQGCFARFGLTEAQVDGFKSGGAATITIYSIVDAENPVVGTLSLAGFTDAVASLAAR